MYGVGRHNSLKLKESIIVLENVASAYLASRKIENLRGILFYEMPGGFILKSG